MMDPAFANPLGVFKGSVTQEARLGRSCSLRAQGTQAQEARLNEKHC